MFVQAYINTALAILQTYNGEEPFNAYAKKYFALNKKFGSRDRKQIAHLCYCFFRLGKSLKDFSIENRLAIGFFLCNANPHPILQFLNGGWNEKAMLDVEEKINLLKEKYDFEIGDIFGLSDHFSNEIEFDLLSFSILIQPDTYLRIRPGEENIVLEKLQTAGFAFNRMGEKCVAVPPSTKVETHLLLNKEVVVQDLSSQQVLKPLLEYRKGKALKQAWDCCAASGGKSILLKDYFQDVALTVSDIRQSILSNLDKRFQQAGIKQYKSFLADLSTSSFNIKNKFDLVICDAPCTGSGTWGRTPEQLYFFDEKKIEHYSSLQKKILTNGAKGIREGGMLLYITCSVFREENEGAVQFVQQHLQLQLVKSEYIKGYSKKADTLFTALFVL